MGFAGMGWKTRLALVISALWLLLIFAIARTERESASVFIGFGALPLAVLWGLAWVVRGYLSQRKPKEPRPPDPERRSAWILRGIAFALLVASVAAIEYFSERAGHSAGNTGYLVGYYVWGILLAWVLWRGPLKRRPGALALSIALMYGTAAIWESYKLNSEFNDANNFARYGSALLARMANGEKVSDADIATARAGRYGPVLLAIRNHFARTGDASKQMGAVLEAADLANLLSPQTVASLDGLNSAQARLALLKPAIADSELRLKQSRIQFEVELKASDAPEAAKRAMMEGLKTNPMMRDDVAITRFFDLQRAIVQSADEILALLKSRQGKYVHQGNRILFADARDLAAYNRHHQRLVALIGQESAMHGAEKKRMFDGVKDLSGMAK